MAGEQRLYNNVAPLANVQALTELVDRVQNRPHGLPGMACFFGRSGDGKSTAGIYAANRFQAVLVQVKSAWSPKMLCEAILRETGASLKRSETIGHMVERISEQLAYSGTPLLIDEADHLVKKRTIEIVRDIHEGSGAPVILIGEEEMPQKLKQWERVHGRMLDWVGAQPGSMADVAMLAPIYAAGVDISEDLRAAILRASHASVRRICVNLSRVAEHARTQGLDRVTAEDWGKRALFTGEAPVARRNIA
ncbi:AAA family ATPase [Maritimibacter sp. HL-12]|uniref:AAA family ATPase n=1 Tax=Maritimibacter sp. HL-12 TaxID=1162418 RepID=UPI000A0F1074|nr:ATP-binding protein [Maritimibacter sp. HL-12]SMH36028.1 AAA domain-containing protein [Maritimibacter sp. HL-12]